MNHPFHFPNPFRHEHGPIRNVNEAFDETLSLGQRAADRVAATMGSWTFIIIQSVFLTGWLAINALAWARHWDPYPFILMNLLLSLQAAYAAPIIMMSQHRQSSRDRIEAHNDFLINLKAEEEIRVILEHLEAQNQALLELHRRLGELRGKEMTDVE
jgi:uncharacterized membrane protein